MVDVRFVELEPPRRIVEAVSFVTADPALLGEMTIMVTFDAMPDGTEVTFLCKDLPPGLRAEDNEAGSRLVVAAVGPSLRMTGVGVFAWSRPATRPASCRHAPGASGEQVWVLQHYRCHRLRAELSNPLPVVHPREAGIQPGSPLSRNDSNGPFTRVLSPCHSRLT